MEEDEGQGWLEHAGRPGEDIWERGFKDLVGEVAKALERTTIL